MAEQTSEQRRQYIRRINNSLEVLYSEGETRDLLTFDIVTKPPWKYCGGNAGSHNNYFNQCLKTMRKHYTRKYFAVPPHKTHCLCEHRIEQNCFTTDGTQILVWGNCCINQFVEMSSRTCATCDAPHKNRKNNYCNDCRKKYDDAKRRALKMHKCSQCNRLCDKKYSYCYSCTTAAINPLDSTPSAHKCRQCNKSCDTKYTYCYSCKTAKETAQEMHKCGQCGRKCDKKYYLCYTCNMT